MIVLFYLDSDTDKFVTYSVTDNIDEVPDLGFLVLGNKVVDRIQVKEHYQYDLLIYFIYVRKEI